MTFEEAKKSIRWILTVSHPIGSWELENIMDALDITPCDISTCKVAKALWGNKGNIPDIDISRVKNGTPLEAQQNRCNSCIHLEEQNGSNCYECIKGMADNFEEQPTDKVKCNHTTEEIAKSFIEDVEAVKDQLDGQPMDADCISRSELLRHQHIIYDDDGEDYRAVYVKDIRALPSVTPERPKGKWIYKEYDDRTGIGDSFFCSECGEPRCMKLIKYCPNCGSYNGGGER